MFFNKMKINLGVFIIIVTLFSACNKDEDDINQNQIDPGQTTQDPDPELQLVWSDEFDTDGSIDLSKWVFDTGTPNNNEEQIYTSSLNNIIVEDGILKITAIRGQASAAVYYYDELNLLNSAGEIVSEIESFEVNSPTLNDFDGASTRIIDNPDISAGNSTSRVVEFKKNIGANGNAGVWWDRNNAVDPSVNNKLSLKTWSPETNIVVRLKLENSANSSEFHEVDAQTTLTNTWETLTYDFSGAPAYNYDRLVVFFDHGTTNANYTSGRITTQNKYNFTYGRVDARAKLPSAGGVWPAIWMLGSNFGAVGWPACGEIDIMEYVGNSPGKISSALHTPSSSGATINFMEKSISNETTEFHIFSTIWTAGSITFLLDDVPYYTYNPATKNNQTWPFNKDQFIILNLALGGNLGGTIDPNFDTATFEIDYIRVYQ